MNNRLTDLNNYLFEQLERLNDDENLNEENFNREIERSKAITQIGNTIINNAKLALDGKKYMDEMGNSKAVPLMLQENNK